MFNAYIHHPQRLWLRRMLFQIHLWTGILLAAYLFVIGLTGSLLVFEDEFTALSLPKSADSQVGSTLRLTTIVTTAEHSAIGSHAFFLSFPEAQVQYFRMWLKAPDGHQSVVAIDASTGMVRSSSRLWIEWIHDLHVSLLLGPTGLLVNGLGAACLVLLSLTGIVLWWPGLVRWTRGLWINTQSNWRRINFDIHSAMGFWTLGISIWWGLSGIYFAWPAQFSRAVDMVSKLQGMRAPSVPQEHGSGNVRVPLESMVNAARRVTPGGRVSGIALPTSPGEDVIVYVDRGQAGDFSHRDIHYFSSSGDLLTTWHYGDNHTAGDWFLWAMHPLHFGTLWGWEVKIIWALLGLSLPALSVTGLFMYWNRRLRFAVSHHLDESDNSFRWRR